MGVSCDICKYGCEHDYVRNNYYCSNKNSCHPIADSPIVKNCRYGEIDQWKYDFKYKPNKSDKNVSKKLMYEELKKRPSFASCATDEDVVRTLSSLESKAGQYDALVKERDTLKASLDGYVEKEREARKAEIKNLLEDAMQDGRIAPSDRDAYQAVLEKDYENGRRIVDGLAKKKSVDDVPAPPLQDKSGWNDNWKEIRKKNGFN